MKHSLMLLCLMASMYSYSQFGIKFGPNLSYFSQGDKTKSGINLASVGFIGGFYDDIHLGEKTSLDISILYAHGGAKTPDVSYRTYSTYSIVLPVAFSYHIGAISLKGGGYLSRMVYARDYDFEGAVYGWAVGAWRYMKRYDYGATVGISFNFTSCLLEVNYNRGIPDIRGPEKTSTRYDGCRTSAFSAMLKIPLKTFSKN